MEWKAAVSCHRILSVWETWWMAGWLTSWWACAGHRLFRFNNLAFANPSLLSALVQIWLSWALKNQHNNSLVKPHCLYSGLLLQTGETQVVQSLLERTSANPKSPNFPPLLYFPICLKATTSACQEEEKAFSGIFSVCLTKSSPGPKVTPSRWSPSSLPLFH